MAPPDVAAESGEPIELRRARIAGTFDVWLRLAWVPHILALCAPLWIVKEIVAEIAGKETQFDFAVQASVVVSFVLSSAVVGLFATVRRQSRENERLRERIRELEAGQ